MNIKSIYVGGWFQRTTLHLSEVYDYLKSGATPLALDKKVLKKNLAGLEIEGLRMELGPFDAIRIETKKGLRVSIYEDGLILLKRRGTKNVGQGIEAIREYYERRLSPAIGYLFSLGAPVPKELANIKTIYPYFVVTRQAKKTDVSRLLKSFKQDEYFEHHAPGYDVYRGDKLYIINRRNEKMSAIERFIEEQIFIREFKTQMHRYLNLHRLIWEKIADVKERGVIRGNEISAFKEKLESYDKTITLIDARIEQMDTYIATRESIFKKTSELASFLPVLEFKYETLADTLEYIKDLWKMTREYVRSALEVFQGLAAKSTDNSVKNLTVVTSMGVGATLIGLFTQEAPSFTKFGLLYFVVLAIVGFSVERVMRIIGQRRMYRIRDAKIARDL